MNNTNKSGLLSIRGGKIALQQLFNNPQNSWLKAVRWRVKQDENGVLTLTPMGYVTSSMTYKRGA